MILHMAILSKSSGKDRFVSNRDVYATPIHQETAGAPRRMTAFLTCGRSSVQPRAGRSRGRSSSLFPAPGRRAARVRAYVGLPGRRRQSPTSGHPVLGVKFPGPTRQLRKYDAVWPNDRYQIRKRPLRMALTNGRFWPKAAVALKPSRMSELGQSETFRDPARNVRFWVISGRRRSAFRGGKIIS